MTHSRFPEIKKQTMVIQVEFDLAVTKPEAILIVKKHLDGVRSAVETEIRRGDEVFGLTMKVTIVS